MHTCMFITIFIIGNKCSATVLLMHHPGSLLIVYVHTHTGILFVLQRHKSPRWRPSSSPLMTGYCAPIDDHKNSPGELP